MPRVKRGVTARKRHKRFLEHAEGFYGRKKNVWSKAYEQVMKGWKTAYKGRKLKKRDYRSLWIVRINAACRENNISYSKFMDGMNKSGITLNRKQLAELAATDAKAFTKLADIAKEKTAVSSN